VNQLESFHDRWRRHSTQSPCLDTHSASDFSEPAHGVRKALNNSAGTRRL
jgi:hypothetical protein